MVALPPPPASIVYDDVSLDGQHVFVRRGRVIVLREASDPVWSPDGRFIAAFQGRGIAVATPDGGVVRRVRTIGSTAHLTWSPDGRWFAYLALHCGGGPADPACATLWVVRADGTGQRRASPEGAVSLVTSFNRPYAWAPDGRRVVYAGDTGLVVSDVVTARRRLVGRGDDPDWSPDGARLLYRHRVVLETSAPDGSRRRPVRGAGNTTLATWSPDATRIAYIHQTQTRWILFVSHPDGSARVRLGVVQADAPLIWSRDGRYLLVGVAGEVRFEIFAADGRTRPRFVRGGENGDWR